MGTMSVACSEQLGATKKVESWSVSRGRQSRFSSSICIVFASSDSGDHAMHLGRSVVPRSLKYQSSAYVENFKCQNNLIIIAKDSDSLSS